MNETTSRAFLRRVSAQRGHFRLESGHHSGLWLDLDPLFANPRDITPFVSALARLLLPHGASMVCGPLLGGAFLAQLVAHQLDLEFCFTQREMAPQSDGLFRARYILPESFRSRVRDKRVAIVDDAMSAGSALRGTFAELESHGAVPVVAGALLVLGTTGVDFFSDRRIPVEAVARESYDLWLPEKCELCTAGIPLDRG